LSDNADLGATQRLRRWFERWWYRKPRRRLILQLFDIIQNEEPQTIVQVLERRRKC